MATACKTKEDTRDCASARSSTFVHSKEKKKKNPSVTEWIREGGEGMLSNNTCPMKVTSYEVLRQRNSNHITICGCRLHPILLLSVLSCIATFASHRWAMYHTTQPFMYRRSLPRNTSWLPDIRSGYLVYSHACQIPEISAHHPSLQRLLSTSARINCSESYPMFSFNTLDRLYINSEAITNTTQNTPALQPVSCCYHRIYRGVDDDSVEEDSQCVPVTNGSLIVDEFIRLVCYDAKDVLAYVSYHAFVVNKTAVDRRLAAHANDGRYRYSVLALGADGMSRQSMLRQLPKTVTFLKKNMTAIELKGVNKVGDDTLTNLLPLLTGLHYDEADVMHGLSRHLDWYPFVWKAYKDAGYVTMYAEDNPEISTFNYLKIGFHRPPTDYYPRTLLLPFEKAVGHHKALSCRYCVGPILQAEFILNYLRDFATRYRNSPYFAFAWVNSLSHDFSTSRWVGDELYHSFFKTLQEAGHLQNTIVLFLSDHGMRWGAIRRTYAGQMEDRLPGHFWALPPRFHKRHPRLVKAMAYNAHRLTSPLDTFATFTSIQRDFFYTENDTEIFKEDCGKAFETVRMKSLFKKLPRERSCEDLDMDEQWCTCHRQIPVDVNNATVINAAEFVVERINEQLDNYKHICATVLLQNITAAYRHSIEDKSDMSDFTVTLSTAPSGYYYEATVRIYKYSMQVLGGITLLSYYGNHDTCVADKKLKKICYCMTTAQLH
ncbi:uncharacterized protein LOC135389720 [Ornithodoros turicata]|uniref:uncharacterized protein LOC135389720 n=1 Tax=Ornithodoros turicata TaxID=34597 RepID=UPI003138F259